VPRFHRLCLAGMHAFAIPGGCKAEQLMPLHANAPEPLSIPICLVQRFYGQAAAAAFFHLERVAMSPLYAGQLLALNTR
jgi:hypothetical protein